MRAQRTNDGENNGANELNHSLYFDRYNERVIEIQATVNQGEPPEFYICYGLI